MDRKGEPNLHFLFIIVHRVLHNSIDFILLYLGYSSLSMGKIYIYTNFHNYFFFILYYQLFLFLQRHLPSSSILVTSHFKSKIIWIFFRDLQRYTNFFKRFVLQFGTVHVYVIQYFAFFIRKTRRNNFLATKIRLPQLKISMTCQTSGLSNPPLLSYRSNKLKKLGKCFLESYIPLHQ